MKKQFCCLACLLAVFALCCCAQKPNANACFLDDNTLPLNAAQEEIIRKKHLAYVQEHGGYSGGARASCHHRQPAVFSLLFF